MEPKNIDEFKIKLDYITKELIGKKIERNYLSYSRHIFFNFGNFTETLSRKGDPYREYDWTVWIGNASWRITFQEKHLVGSEDSHELIEKALRQMLGLKFISYKFLSEYLDLQIEFENGYQITTFFNWLAEDQWVIFLPDRFAVTTNFENIADTKKYSEIFKESTFVNNFERINLFDTFKITEIGRNEDGFPVLIGEPETILDTYNSLWRLEKNTNYICGCTDEVFGNIVENTQWNELVGKQMLAIEVSNDRRDARFHFEDGYTIILFTVFDRKYSWKLIKNGETVFKAFIKGTNAFTTS